MNNFIKLYYDHLPYKVSQMNSTQQIVLSELIRRENFDPFYTPMTTATATMLEVLEEAI